MKITLEEARTLDALARAGSFAKAAEALRKSHPAVIYSIRSMEEQTGLKLLDRSSYRTRLTRAGERVWKECRRLLTAEQELEKVCQDLGSGWEPDLKIVVDGLVPFDTILRALQSLRERKVPTQVRVYEEFLSGVEATFTQLKADLMISVLPPEKNSLETIRLRPIKSYLVASAKHPLGRHKGRVPLATLREHAFLTVRGSDVRLNLPTSLLEESSAYHLSNFQSKKSAILQGLGYGWLPEALVRQELDAGRLRIVRWENESVHEFVPHAHTRGSRRLGRAGRAFMDAYLTFERGQKA